ncbi:MAG TPA: GvpL/GvpF family gas vesicle protein [Rhodothermales bacterium]|nr:GvpL/GvpF family gas vesicle protein [Rhodothermales bacterium]
MGTSQENHQDEAEKNVGRLLKEGNNGSLARAKETLKGRLYQQMIEEVQSSFEDAEEVARQALEEEADWEAPLAAARSALKKQLIARMVQQALEEVHLELEDTERVVEEAMQDVSADQDALGRIKQAFKDRLLADMLEEAIAEIQDEVGSAESPEDPEVEPYEVEPHDEEAQEMVEAQDEAEETRAEETPTDQEEEVIEAAEPTEVVRDLLDDEGSAPLIDMHFWQDEDEVDSEGTSPSEPFESVTEASEELGADPDFFPQDVVMEPGESSGDGSSAEPIADGTPISFLAGFSMEAAELDEVGDGASHEVEATDAHEEMTLEEGDLKAEDGAGERGAYYVYGVFPSNSDVDESHLPNTGVDPEFPLFVYIHGDLSAVASAVDPATFGAEALVENLQDEQWSEAAHLMHNGLVESCRSIPGFLALPFGRVYGSLDQVQHLLELTQSTDIVGRTVGRNEWTVRVYRNRERLHQRIMERSETVQGIMAEIKSKPKGEAAAIKKRMVSTIQDEIAQTTDRCTSEVHEQLLTYADEARLGTPDRNSDEDKGEGIFDATYLIHQDKEFDFHTDLEALYRDYEDLGFQVDVVGPISPVLEVSTSLSTSD